MTIKVGSIVRAYGLAGYWQVLSVDEDPRTHSVIPIYRATLRPLGERMSKVERVALVVDLTLAPVDLEELP